MDFRISLNDIFYMSKVNKFELKVETISFAINVPYLNLDQCWCDHSIGTDSIKTVCLSSCLPNIYPIFIHFRIKLALKSTSLD